MHHAVAKLRAQGTARVLALQSAGTVFCAGGNPFASRGARSLAAFVQGLRASFEGYVGLATLRVPVVCAVHGAMVGGAAAIFLQTDVRVADRSATFQHGNLSRGVCPIAGYSRSLVEVVGVLGAFPCLSAACRCPTPVRACLTSVSCRASACRCLTSACTSLLTTTRSCPLKQVRSSSISLTARSLPLKHSPRDSFRPRELVITRLPRPPTTLPLTAHHDALPA